MKFDTEPGSSAGASPTIAEIPITRVQQLPFQHYLQAQHALIVAEDLSLDIERQGDVKELLDRREYALKIAQIHATLASAPQPGPA